MARAFPRPPVEALIAGVDDALRTLFVRAPAQRDVPGRSLAEAALSGEERRHAGALMRVNHVGEVCAQALYRGQRAACRDAGVVRALEQAAIEETDHLAWTETRIAELGSHKSLLNPLWYLGAFAIGAAAGALGERWSLGFLAETERQVEAHLDRHLGSLPEADARSRAIVEQMKSDEIGHAQTAEALGAADLPWFARTAMRLAAGVMTRTAYRL